MINIRLPDFHIPLTAIATFIISSPSTLLAVPPPEAKTIHFSDCDEKPCSSTESIRYFYDLDKLSITHTNAWLNCGIKGAKLVIKSDTPGIHSVQEEQIHETTKHPDGSTSKIVEQCLCYYTIAFEIINPKTGKYIYKIQNPSRNDPRAFVIDIDESKRSSGTINIRPVPVNLNRN